MTREYACDPACVPCRKGAACTVKPAKPVRIRQNNEIDPIPLLCGCTVPYPVITLLGSRPKKVWCDLHNGWYSIQKPKKPKKKSGEKTLDIPDF